MTKYHSTAVVFQEVPGEVSLAINITNCQGTCPGCHSPHLREDIGRPLYEDLPKLLEENDGVTCVAFMGEGNDPTDLVRCITYVKSKGLKTCLYSGQDYTLVNIEYFDDMIEYLDYLKEGPYIEELGGLDNPGTNQCMYQRQTDDGKYYYWEDITYKFWRKKE